MVLPSPPICPVSRFRLSFPMSPLTLPSLHPVSQMLQELVASLPLSMILSGLVSATMGPQLRRPFVSVPVRQLLFDGSPVPALKSLLRLPGTGAILDGLCGRGLCGSPRDLERLKNGRFPSMMVSVRDVTGMSVCYLCRYVAIRQRLFYCWIG